MSQSETNKGILKLSMDKVNFDELVSPYTISNQTAFLSYLNDVWRDLSNRGVNPLYINKLVFSSYYNVSGIINERLFSVFDINNDEKLTRDEFINGMKRLFTNDYHSLTKMIFELYDFDKNRLISKEDIRLVLSYVSLSKEDMGDMGYIDRVHSQEELETILNESFSMFKSENIDYEHFLDMIENYNSNVFFYILFFIYTNKPFTPGVLRNYEGNQLFTTKSTFSSSTTKDSLQTKQIMSPNRSCNFSPCHFLSAPIKKHKSYQMKNSLDKYCENNVYNKEVPFKTSQSKFVKYKTQNDTIDNDLSPSKDILAKIRQKYYNQEEDDENDMKNNQLIFQDNDNDNLKSSIDNNIHCIGLRIEKGLEEIDIESDDSDDNDFSYMKPNEPSSTVINNRIEIQSVIKEGYLYTRTKELTVNKIYIKLIDKDMFIFQSKEAKHHQSMKNLSGIFVKDLPPQNINGMIYYPFSLILSSNNEIYYADTESEHDDWLETFCNLTNCRNVNDAYTIKEKIGEGRFGKVHLATNKLSNENVAIKIFDKPDMTIEEIQLMKTEIEILKICQHPNIIRLIEMFENEKHIYIIMEYCSGGDLFSYLQKRNFKLSEKRACKLIHKICTAVFFLHSYGIVHRDLKPENILMTNDSNNADLRILDFGLSKFLGPNQNITNETYGTIAYTAPEVLQGLPYSHAVDIFSIGILTYLFLSSDLPFEDPDEDEVNRKTMKEPHSYDKNSVWKYITKEAKDFVDHCLEKDVSKRITMKKALDHPWFKEFLKGTNSNNNSNNGDDSPKYVRKAKTSQFKVYTCVEELVKQY